MTSVYSKRKIVFTMAIWGAGGMERVATYIANGLYQLGWKPIFVIGKTTELIMPFPQYARIYILNTYVTPSERNLQSLASSLLSSRKLFTRVLQKENPDVIVSLDPYTAWLTFILGRRPTVFWFHSSIKQLFQQSKTWPINKWLLRRLDAIVVLNNAMKEECFEVFGQNIESRIYVIPNPVTTQLGRSLYVPGSNIFVFVGRLSNRQKRLDRLFKALTLLTDPKWKLLIIGSGPDKKMLFQLANILKINEHIEFLGWVADPWQEIAKRGGAEALVLSSDYEGFSLVLVEAMANGLPCIAVDCPVGPNEIIINGINGLLVSLYHNEEKTIKALASAIENVLSRKIVFDEKIVQASIQRFTLDKVLSDWNKLLKKLTN
ncbi:MAG: glycosyltransferase [Nitrososphaeria archaeon]